MDSMDSMDGIETRKNSSIMLVNIIWPIIVFIFLIISYLGYGDDPELEEVTFWKFLLLIIIVTLFTYVGAIIGDLLRRFVAPSMVFTSGGFFALLWSRIFWAIGPQVVGVFLGVWIGLGIASGIPGLESFKLR